MLVLAAAVTSLAYGRNSHFDATAAVFTAAKHRA